MEEQFNKEAKEGWWFAANAAIIIDETTGSEDPCQEEFSWQSTATWEQLWERKKGRLSLSQATQEELPKHG